MHAGDTIAAIATAPGRAGVAVVRVSGPAAPSVAAALAGRAFSAGRIAHAVLRDAAGAVLDDAVVLSFAAPHSYTGEDVVEFQCHGGTVTPRRILEAAIAAGARLARRGEFTERAFLNGKLGLDQAESVLDLIDAKTARAADAALEGLAGRRAKAARTLYERALDLSARAEHALDVDEGELPEDFVTGLDADIRRLAADMDAAIRRVREGKILRTGALVVLVGPPNVGKSSLMNALLGEGRVLVSDVAGTTRDSIEEWLDVDGWPVRLVDTAGLRETADAIEAAGVARTRNLAKEADVLVRLAAATDGKDASPAADAAPAARPQTVLSVRTKCDLLPDSAARTDDVGSLFVSAKTGEGLVDLKAALAARVASLEPPESTEAVEGLLEARRLLVSDGDEDLVLLANRLRAVAECLGRQVGAVYTDDMLERLFSRFCVGK